MSTKCGCPAYYLIPLNKQ